MISASLQFLGFLLGFLGSLLILVVITRSLLSDLWKIAFLSELPSRRLAAQIIFILVGLPIVVASTLFFGPKRLDAVIFAGIAITPALAWYALDWWAWWRDDLETRSAALDLARERASRERNAPPSIDQAAPWKDYVFDVEAARRRTEYEPPPI